MKIFSLPFFLTGLLLPALVGLAQETPAPAAPPPPPPATSPDTTPPPPAAENPPSLRRLDGPTPEIEAARPPVPATPHRRNNDDRVAILSDAHVEADETIHGEAVAILGQLTIDGEVHGDAVSVLGGSTINGKVHGDVVVVLGDLRLGPAARIEGEIVSVGGRIDRAPGAYVGRGIVHQSIGKNFHISRPLQSWWDRALKLGRPLAFGRELAWLWTATIFTLAFYALLALLFPAAIRRTGEMLILRPVAVIASAMLTMIALPLVFVLLLMTVIGIPVALIVLPTGVILSTLFGKAAIYGLIGRRISNDTLHPALAVVVGGAIFILLYLVPIAGLPLTFLVSMLGFGCSIVALSSSREKPRTTPPIPPASSGFTTAGGFPSNPPPPASSATSFFGATASQTPVAPLSAMGPSLGVTAATASSAVPPETIPPEDATGWTRFPKTSPVEPTRLSSPTPLAAVPPAPVVPNATLPRASFWIRMGALLIDVTIICVIFGPMGAGPLIFPFLAAYSACMWKMRGTTVGGIVCGLCIVRLDDRPLDWPTAIVRSLGCFLSLIVAGLGFIWVLFDEERQSWHDKIAGTVVVHAPKGTSLV